MLSANLATVACYPVLGKMPATVLKKITAVPQSLIHYQFHPNISG